MRRRRRGTAIVDTSKGILVAAGRGKVFILPGGGAGHKETRMKAAIRELEEETGMKALSSKFLFRHRGRPNKDYRGGLYQDHHTVCLVKAKGQPRPKREVKYIGYYRQNSKIRVSRTTKEIIERYYEYKRRSHPLSWIKDLFKRA